MPSIQSVRTGQFVINNGVANAPVITGPNPSPLTFVPPLAAAPGQVIASIASPVNGLFICPGPAGIGNVVWSNQKFEWFIQIDTGNTGTITNPFTALPFSQNLRIAPNIPLVAKYAVPPEELVFNFAS